MLEVLYLGDKTKPDISLDCVGLYCPEPVFRTRQEIDKLEAGEVLEVVADDIPRLVKRLGNLKLVDMYKDDDEIHFVIKKVE